MMPTSTVDNQPVFNGVTDYTQRGDFQVNANGNLVNGAGYYLMGVAVDPTTGNPVGSVPQVLQFQNNFIPAVATSSIQYAVNLPTTPSTTAAPRQRPAASWPRVGLIPATSPPETTRWSDRHAARIQTTSGHRHRHDRQPSATVPSSATALSGAAGNQFACRRASWPATPSR